MDFILILHSNILTNMARMKTIRPFIIILLMIIPLVSSGQTSEALMGHWKLISIDKYGIELEVEDKDYFLEFQKSTIQFTIVPNQCYENYHIEGNSIITDGERGCESKVLPNPPETVKNANAQIDYNGKYTLRDGKLTITNDKATFHLVRK